MAHTPSLTMTHLIPLFERDLEKLASEITAYVSEEDLWRQGGEINNCGGNLCLHIAGNLRHFVGAVLGQTGYLRDRHAEFNEKDVPRAELLRRVDLALKEVKNSLSALPEESLGQPYPIDVFGYSMTTHYFLLHLYGHLNYHLGQVNYHRRMIGSVQ